jgi:hypothetical protein
MLVEGGSAAHMLARQFTATERKRQRSLSAIAYPTIMTPMAELTIVEETAPNMTLCHHWISVIFTKEFDQLSNDYARHLVVIITGRAENWITYIESGCELM